MLALFVSAVISHGQSIGSVFDKSKDAIDKRGDKNEKKTAPTTAQTNSPAVYTGPKKRLGVMDLEVKVTANNTTNATSTGTSSTTTVDLTPPTDFGTGLTEMLTTALINTNRFVVLERKAMADIQAEQTLGASAAVDPASAAKAGRLLGAQVLIRGAVTEYSYKKSSLGGNGVFGKTLGISHAEAEAFVALDVRMYDTVTGQVLDSVRAEGRAKSSGTSAQLDVGNTQIGGSGFDSTPLGQASRQALTQAVNFIISKMEARPWEGAIAEIETEDNNSQPTIYLNAGSELGIKVGDELDVLRAGHEIIDPQTRVSLGRTKDKVIGRIKVESVTPKIAIARPINGTDFKKEDLVHFAGQSITQH